MARIREGFLFLQMFQADRARHSRSDIENQAGKARRFPANKAQNLETKKKQPILAEI